MCLLTLMTPTRPFFRATAARAIMRAPSPELSTLLTFSKLMRMRGVSAAAICGEIASHNSDAAGPIIFPLGSKIAMPFCWRILVVMIFSFFLMVILKYESSSLLNFSTFNFCIRLL